MDVARYTRLIDAHYAALVLYARQWVVTPEDVVQEAFLALVQQTRWPEPAAPWLFRVVRNRAISVGRGERRRRRRETRAAQEAPWFHDDPRQHLEAEELRAALEALAAELREVIVAHVWGGLTFEQVGHLVHCSTSMAYRRFVAGVTQLRERLGGVAWQNQPTTR